MLSFINGSLTSFGKRHDCWIYRDNEWKHGGTFEVTGELKARLENKHVSLPLFENFLSDNVSYMRPTSSQQVPLKSAGSEDFRESTPQPCCLCLPTERGDETDQHNWTNAIFRGSPALFLCERPLQNSLWDPVNYLLCRHRNRSSAPPQEAVSVSHLLGSVGAAPSVRSVLTPHSASTSESLQEETLETENLIFSSSRRGKTRSGVW